MALTPLRGRAGRALAISSALVLTGSLVACGDDDDALDVQTPITEAPEAAAETGPETTTPVEEQTLEVGSEFYFAGFRVEVEEARLVPGGDFDEPMVEIDARTENLRDDDAYFPSDGLELRWADQSSMSWSSGQNVRPGATTRDTFEFPVDESFAFDDAVLYGGTERQIQAVVPLGDPEAAVAAAPIPLEVPDGTFRDGVLEVVVTDMSLLPYDPWTFQPEQAALDSPFLVVVMDMVVLETRSGANVSGDSFRLVLPDGTQVAPQQGPILVLEEGATERDVGVAFELRDVPFDEDALADAEYTLLVTPDRGADDASVEITLELVPTGNGDAGGDSAEEADATQDAEETED